jgi:hypothetical protein
MTRSVVIRCAVVIWLGSTAHSSTGAAQQSAHGRDLRIQVDDPRPMSAAVLEVERRFGVVVTYEDTSYVASEDIVDVTAQVRRDGRMSERVRVMRGGPFAFTPVAASALAGNQIETVLDEMVEYWNRAGGSGKFAVEHVDGGHHVMPRARRGVAGAIEPYTSPLDVNIQLSSQDRDGVQTLEELSKAISAASGRRVFVGAAPVAGLRRRTVALGADNETARRVLWRTLQSIDTSLSWQLLCGVGEEASCAINVHPVGQR